MRISSVHIKNFRNFKDCEVVLGQNIVLIGENKAGKSNFITALRLILDPLQNRQLNGDDFWDGDGSPFDGRSIEVTVKISDFGGDQPDLISLAWLSQCLIETEPPVAQLTYRFYPDTDVENNQISRRDYKWDIYPKQGVGQKISLSGMWQDMPLNFINALRDVASDSGSWSRSPLNELVELTDGVSIEKIQPYADKIADESRRMVDELFKTLETGIKRRLLEMVGNLYTVNPRLGLDTSSPDVLLKALRVFIDGDRNRPITRTSLGLQNAIYLSLLSLKLDKKQQRRNNQNKAFLPIVALEEPEAHLHPHLQRLVFKDFLNTAKARKLPVIISSHSPYLVTASDINDLVLIRDSMEKGSLAFSAANFLKTLSDRDRKDLDRFLDITKSEMVFAKGVIFVEGDVEVLLIEVFTKVMDIDLDEYGITVCNVYGVNFDHVVMLAMKLNIHFAILTDGDETKPVTGLQRGIKLMKLINAEEQTKTGEISEADEVENTNDIKSKLKAKGIFVNEWTLEPALIDAGLAGELKKTFQELGEELGQNVRAGAEHIDTYKANQTNENMEKILTAISDTRWGKGRFAHRLCTHILSKSQQIEDKLARQQIVPAYIREALDYLINQVKPATTPTEEA